GVARRDLRTRNDPGPLPDLEGVAEIGHRLGEHSGEAAGFGVIPSGKFVAADDPFFRTQIDPVHRIADLTVHASLSPLPDRATPRADFLRRASYRRRRRRATRSSGAQPTQTAISRG